ncbi:hypothetical protein FNU76_07030 [Chitinimonas arctica]|uniref:Uncharacterized protein n=1 Tax=Chitinimonas arctica TaxID=2594795 RepID=A0A516SDL7_9NEIS|nr:hypothetical protein [Chitinimonas arctica]QDQ26128.1 hypothetical protein FNU76_07030 [Chitinimonas arctica]
MKHAYLKSALLCALVSSSLTAAAIPNGDGWRWQTGLKLTPSAVLDYRGQRIEDHPRSDYRKVTEARDKLYAELKQGLYSRVQAELAHESGYRWHTVEIRGPIQLAITPSNTGVGPNVSLGQFSAELRTNFKQSWGPFSAECTVSANTGTLNLSGNLDVINGMLANLRIVDLQPSTGRDCSSSFSWIPILGQITDRFLNKQVDSMLNGAFSQVMGRAQDTFAPVKFAGLNTAIPAGKYMYGSFDAGQYVTNNLSHLISQTHVVVRFSEPRTRLSPRTLPPEGDNQVTELDEAFSITFPSAANGNIGFTVYDQTLFNRYWECRPMKPICQPPQDQ